MKPVYGTLDVKDDPTPWVIVSPNDDKEWCVLWIQGWGNSIENHLAAITRMADVSGVSFAMADLAGHGSHPIAIEQSSKQMQHIEVLELYDTLKKLGYKKIITIGGSFGAYMAALLSGKRVLSGVVLRVPSCYPNDEFERPYNKTRQYQGSSPDKYAFDTAPEAHLSSTAFEAVAGYEGPVYVIEHESDEVVPAAVPQRYFSVSKHGNYLRVPGAPHSPKTSSDPRRYYQYIEHLLTSIIRLIQLTP